MAKKDRNEKRIEQFRVWDRVCEAYYGLESCDDLIKAGLTLYDYREMYELMQDIANCEEALTINSGIAKWFKSYGLKVRRRYNGYGISLPVF